jgi:P-type Cu+ transporter
MGEARTEQQEGERMYACPMHPDVRQREPGTCPKCGMELEPTKD